MSKKKKRQANKSKKPKTNSGLTFTKVEKPTPKRTDLENTLKSVYEDTISLETKCCHKCECCNVAMPQINYCEFINIVTALWKDEDDSIKIDFICTSIEYYFRNEYDKWGMDSLIKPCMFLKDNMCSIYENRPLACRLYGQWPEKMYNERVDKFEKAYAKYGLTRKDLPLGRQCGDVTRVDTSQELTEEVIESLYDMLDDLDKTVGDFSSLQVKQKENYRTFHDWLLLKIFGEEWLSMITSFILAANREQMEDQIGQLQVAVQEKFKIKLVDIKDTL